MIDVEKLNALVDNELTPAERSDVEAMIANDPQAAAELGSIRALKATVAEKVRPVKCEDEWKSCVKRLNEIDGARRTKAVVDRWAWAMCTVLFFFIFSVGAINRAHPGVHGGTGDIARAGMEKPVRDVYHWLKNEFGVTPAVPLHIVEAHQGLYDGRPVANIHLKDSQGDMRLVLVPGSVQIDGVTPMDDGNHFACKTGEATSVVWGEDGIVMVLTGKRDANDLRNIANSIHLGN